MLTGEMYTVIGEHVFPFLRTVGGDGSTYAHHMTECPLLLEAALKRKPWPTPMRGHPVFMPRALWK